MSAPAPEDCEESHSETRHVLEIKELKFAQM
jgi:hypothetical protein